MPLHRVSPGGKVVDMAPQHLEPRIAPPRSVAHQTPPRITQYMSSHRRVVLRVMPPRPPDDQLHSPRRRARSPSRGASKVDVIVSPERTRHIKTPLLRADVARLNVLGSMSACRLVGTAPPSPEPREAQRSLVDFLCAIHQGVVVHLLLR